MVLFNSILTNVVYSSSISPSFSVKEVVDDTNSMNNDRVSLLLDNTGDHFTTNYPDIQLVDYFSDGHILNATIWFKNPGGNYSLQCGMFIDADSNPASGYGGMEYELMAAGRLVQGQQVGMWNQSLVQHSSRIEFYTEIRNEEYQDILGQSAYSEFMEPSSMYCPLSLDLSLINYPTAYQVLFYLHSREEKAMDFTNWIDIPPSQLSVITNPKELVFRPGDNQTIPVQIKSSSTTFSRVIDIDTLPVFKDSNAPNVTVKSIHPPLLGIDVPHDALGIYSIPMRLNVSSTSFAPILGDSSSVGVSNTAREKSSEISRLYPARGYMIGVTNLTLVVLRPLTVVENFKAFWDVFGQPISIVLGGFAGGAASLMLDRFKKEKKN